MQNPRICGSDDCIDIEAFTFSETTTLKIDVSNVGFYKCRVTVELTSGQVKASALIFGKDNLGGIMSETISIPLESLRRSASFYPDSSVPSAIEEASNPGLSPITDDPSSLGAHWEGSSTQAVVFQTTLPKTSPTR